MRFPPPDGLRARLAHHLTALAARPLYWDSGGPIPTELVTEPKTFLVPVPAGALHTLAWGEADPSTPPVVLLHGLNANARYFTGVACLLARHRRVLAVDLRGHGSTGPLHGGYDLADTREDLTAWLDALDLRQVDLVGHSWGGRVAADLAAARPERIRRLALVDPVSPHGLNPLIRHARAVAAAVLSPERAHFASEEELARAHQILSWLRYAEPWMHRAFDASFRRLEDGSYCPVLPEAGFRAIYDDVLPRPNPLPIDRITAQVLLILATFSVMAWPGQVRSVKKQLPGLRIVRVPGEHSLHATNPTGLTRALGPFLAGSLS